VRHHHRVVQIDLTALPDDPNILQQMLRGKRSFKTLL
jgi:hypothetical protein